MRTAFGAMVFTTKWPSVKAIHITGANSKIDNNNFFISHRFISFWLQSYTTFLINAKDFVSEFL